MTQEERDLVKRDLLPRIYYGVKVDFAGSSVKGNTLGGYYNYVSDEFYFIEAEMWVDVQYFKPYLRPISSMTKEERKVYDKFIYTKHHDWDGHSHYTEYIEKDDTCDFVRWLISHHFDYNHLIERNLALEAPEGMYNF